MGELTKLAKTTTGWNRILTSGSRGKLAREGRAALCFTIWQITQGVSLIGVGKCERGAAEITLSPPVLMNSLP